MPSMKNQLKAMAVLLAVVFFCGCGSDTSNNDVPAAPNTPAIENVNGNLPDSGNSINLNGSQPVDSSRLKDSLKPRS